MSKLFEPITLGAIEAPNRVIMAPLTRGRSTRNHVPSDFMHTYYSQRATAGLIISEGIGISRQGLGWPSAPGIWSMNQVEAWRPIVEATHAAGGRIFAQLWHMGRVVHPSFIDGQAPVSSSHTLAPGEARTDDGMRPYAPAEALTEDGIAGVIDDYRAAARNAIEAGFDGVQLHAANGYLIDQFLRDGTNHRTDRYGGSVEKRVRLLAEVTTALAEEVGADRTAVRISPNDDAQGCVDSDPEQLFVAAATALSDLNIAFVELRAARPQSVFRPAVRQLVPAIRKAYEGPLVLNQDFGLDDATEALSSGVADAISYGRPFIANPDLPRRLAIGAALNPADPATFYTPGPLGYIDYPSMAN
ncbi:alkene reductase [Ensifer adhaerens]|uniref:alkene reductase n=1 Tax=Ensifer adhaerens TaxID=106592 RepID=UPI000DC4C05F|nr:alkene reductase [Ensifer adhaerens]RAR98916.1 2,4-dienoyl-CoA reductase-like NADH-dependent reductase (Old Yellow Enzyme family) [Ensifer adhaerens]